MTPSLYLIVECQNPDCHFRFPAAGHKPQVCPNCHQDQLVTKPIDPIQVDAIQSIPSSPLYGALLDNIRSIYNVGSIFRTADGLSLEHLHLCGITATPDHIRLSKTALGSENSITWSHHLNGLNAARSLIDQGFQLWALEGGPGSTSIFDVASIAPLPKIILVVGNEIVGVDPEILNLCSRILFIPMQGVKRSLNVSVAFGVASYYLRFSVQPD
jgi:23S rRNA (guanosine2251-2'-O)-methyltransferase